jgi:flagellar motor switch protein FliN
MSQFNFEPEPATHDQELNRAIDELRGVLHDPRAPGIDALAAASTAGNAAIVMNINRRIGEPVDVMVNGRKIARGEITVLESDPSRFGVRLTEIVTAPKTP